jgi:hypothetical protein
MVAQTAVTQTPPMPPGCNPLEVIDTDDDGFATFNIDYFIENYIRPIFEDIYNMDLSAYNFILFPSENDADLIINAITTPLYTNTVAFFQDTRLRVVYSGSGPASGSSYLTSVAHCYPLETTPVNYDSDQDGVPDSAEDLNGDLMVFNDNTDGDAIPNNYDTDDDNDGVPTADEDYNNDGNPLNDDTDADTVPDYLDHNVALANVAFQKFAFSIYPNPVSNGILNIESDVIITLVSIADISGKHIFSIERPLQQIDISKLAVGIYFVSLDSDKGTTTKKLIVE